VIAVLALASPAGAATQPFGGLEQFAGALGCVSETGAGGCTDGRALAGVTAVAADESRVYAVSPSAGTLVELAADPRDGGFIVTDCFSATDRPGCIEVPALTGASDVAVVGTRVFVTARDSDALLGFTYTDGRLVLDGCAAAARSECTPAPLDEPVALAVSPARDRVWVVSAGSDSVAALTPALQPLGCVQQGAPGACAGGRALADPRDVAVAGDTAVVASSGSDGVALLRAPGGAAPGQVGCVTEGGAEDCVPGEGLAGAAGVATHGDEAYVGSPGAVTELVVPAGGPPSRRATHAAPGAAVAIPAAHHLIADAPSYAGSHVYAGGAGVKPFARDFFTGALSPMTAAAVRPAGAVTGLAVSGDIESTAVYAAVPSAGAVVAFARNIPPSCTTWFESSLPPLPAGLSPTPIPIGCFDANRDTLSYSVETPPALGRIVGFDGSAALYQGPGTNVPPREDSFVVRASDGAESATKRLRVTLDYLAGVRVPPRPPPDMRVLDSRATMDRKGRVTLRLRCRTDGSPCAAALALRRGRRVARASATLRSGATRRVRVRLAKRVRRSIRRSRKGLLLQAVATGRQGDGRSDRATRRIRVRARRAP
jgi:hypothetical protein